MTDEQIIKAFEEILKNQNNKLSLIERAVCDDVLSLTNRQKAEIERLKGEVVTNNIMKTAIIKKEAKSEALMHAFSKFAGHSDYHGDTILCQLKCMAEGKETKSAKPIDTNEIKSEAIKEFAEKLKADVRDDTMSYGFRTVCNITLKINNLVEKMTEVQE